MFGLNLNHVFPNPSFPTITSEVKQSPYTIPGMTKIHLQILTSITGTSARAVRTTLLAKASACTIVSASAENGQEEILNKHLKIPGLEGIKSTFISSVA